MARTRRSAADSLAALTATPPPLPPAPPAVPATFRSEPPEGGDGQRPGLGALSLSALLAMALAALRGTVGVIQDWRQRRLERAAETEPLRRARQRLAQARAETGAAGTAGGSAGGGSGGGRGRVPSSHEWGSRAYRGSGGGHSGGVGGGTPRTGRGSTGATPAGHGHGHGSGGAAKKPRDHRAPTGDASSGTPSRRDNASNGRTSNANSGAGDKPRGTLGTLAVDHSKRRTARQAAEQQQKARQQKADLADAKAARKASKKDSEKDSGKSGPDSTEKTPGDDDRVTLLQAIAAEAQRRWNARRERAEESGTDTDSAGAEQEPADEAGPKSSPDGGQTADGPDGPDEDPPPKSWDWDWMPPPRGGRRDAADAAREATADQGVTITVERADSPGDQARQWTPDPGPTSAGRGVGTGVRGLPRVPHRPAGPRPGTTRTPAREARVSAPAVRLPGTTGVAAEHMTEVTLDDVLDHLADSKSNCLSTYDECARLADKATALKAALADLSEELRARHNLVGNLTSTAMAHLSESMDLLARKAEEMRTSSLRASESVEVAHDEMHDAYRPVQQATADAGLVMPSARIHNEE